jgi:3-oxoacyl-[acyl-carrier-protein] synthase-3
MDTVVMTNVGLTGYGRYTPEEVVTGEEIAERSGIPEEVVTEKMGMREKRVCPPDDDHCTDMSIDAAEEALDEAGVAAEELDLVLYHGSEYKDFVVWSAAANIADRLGADNAYATESYTLCAGCSIAIRKARAQLIAEEIDTALLVTASREEDLLDYTDEDSSFMFNFGSGGAAYVLEADPDEDRARAWVRESAAITDGSFSEDVIMPAGGSRNPTSEDTLDQNLHHLTVPDPDGMKERIAPVSLPNYLSVAEEALEQSGYEADDLGFVAVTHMKRSFHHTLLEELGVDPETDGYYLDEYGHMQSVDQIFALDEGLERDRIEAGDLVLFLAAGTGYTWSGTVLEWLG